ncbi:hypothetical protein PIB30_083951 [Stylosanthes scabra]|uniref:SWIM-type domain-containing protein n=1 Tax=Stylosanthes scabra TaxID=79078 RepID=A0ABU6TRX5_9FABA|nr:hypothetical protein [Stylosanthes scabra]
MVPAPLESYHPQLQKNIHMSYTCDCTGYRATAHTGVICKSRFLDRAAAREKFRVEVAKESARNEKIAKKSLKVKSRAYVYAKGAYAYALPCLGRHVLAETGPYASPERPMRTHQWPDLCL